MTVTWPKAAAIGALCGMASVAMIALPDNDWVMWAPICASIASWGIATDTSFEVG